VIIHSPTAKLDHQSFFLVRQKIRIFLSPLFFSRFEARRRRLATTTTAAAAAAVKAAFQQLQR
jgi:hypothetical protein